MAKRAVWIALLSLLCSSLLMAAPPLAGPGPNATPEVPDWVIPLVAAPEHGAFNFIVDGTTVIRYTDQPPAPYFKDVCLSPQAFCYSCSYPQAPAAPCDRSLCTRPDGTRYYDYTCYGCRGEC